MKSVVVNYLPPLILLLGLLLAWEIGVGVGAVPSFVLPSPSAVGLAMIDTYPLLLPHVGQTLLEVTVGLVVALMVGVATAAALDLSPWLRRALYPLLVTSQTIPIIALAPLLIIWFGFDLLPKVIIVTLFCFFPIAINTADGLAAADPEHVALLTSMGASKQQIWWKVRLPAALPYFFSGLKIAVTYSVVAAIVGEWVGAKQGLGIFMLRSANAFQTAQVFVAIVISSLLSLALFGLVYLLELRLLPWYHTSQRSSNR